MSFGAIKRKAGMGRVFKNRKIFILKNYFIQVVVEQNLFFENFFFQFFTIHPIPGK